MLPRLLRLLFPLYLLLAALPASAAPQPEPTIPLVLKLTGIR
jgi:hypothetical protein